MKKKSKVKKFYILTLLLVLSTSAVSAPLQNKSKSFSLTPFAGYQSGFSFGFLRPLGNTADVPEIEYLLENKEPSAAVSLGYFLTDRIELQVAVFFGWTCIMRNVGTGLAGIPLGKFKVSDAASLLSTGNILFHFPVGEFSIYLTAGAGAVTIIPEDLNNKTRLLLNFGGGLRAKISRFVQAVLDIRDYVSFFNYPEDFDLVYIMIYTQDFKRSQHQLGILAGLRFTL